MEGRYKERVMSIDTSFILKSRKVDNDTIL